MTTTSKNQYADFWQGRYDEQVTPWDLGAVSPHFSSVLENASLPIGKMLVPGSGRAHDAAFFAQRGFEVTAVDYTKGAYIEASKLYGSLENLTIIQDDIFHLPDSFDDQFDYVLEHTCYCAINPSRRQDYVTMCHNVLKPNGQVIGVFWNIEDPDGPPFGTTPEQLTAQFQPEFTLLSLDPVLKNTTGRGGQEFVGHFQKNQIQ